MRVLVPLVCAALIPAFAAAATHPEIAAVIGKKAHAHWSETTVKAAATPAQKAVLKRGRPFTVTGEVIDVSCFLQLGKRGPKHVGCATNCIEHGQLIGIVDDKGTVYTLMPEAHDPRRDGTVDLKPIFLPLLAKRVTVSGMLEEHKGTRTLFVDSGALGEKAATH